VGLFRRKQETLNEKLLREAGLDSSGDELPATSASPEPDAPAETEEQPPRPAWPRLLPTENYLLARADEFDAVVTVKSVLAGDQIEFTTLPNGDIVVDEGEGDLSPLADAVEQKIDRPYKAFANRKTNELWAVGAKRIQVAKVELAAGDSIELTENDGDQKVRVDGEPSNAEVPALVELGRQVNADYCVEAERIDGDCWEVKVSPL
jgi:hypothetical protein